MTLDGIIEENVRLAREIKDVRISIAYIEGQAAEYRAASSKELANRAGRIRVLELTLAKFRDSARWTASDDALLAEGKQ